MNGSLIGGIAIGLVAGGGGVYVYFRYASTVYTLGKALYTKVDGNVARALGHIAKLV